jgi:uncharacterized protein with HEPN domain
MPSDFGPLTDIRDNIALAFSFLGEASVDQFLNDRRTIYAVTRCFAKAIVRTQGSTSADRWQGMAGAGNVYRHEYQRIIDKAVWDTVHDSLQPLLTVVDEELRRLEDS